MCREAWERFGINWNDIIQKEVISRAAVCPFFEEAGSLLKSAGEAWVGQLGAGRVRGQELKALGHQAVEFAQHGFRRALYWTSDQTLPPDVADLSADCLGYNLGKHHPNRSFRPAHDQGKESPELVKSAEASGLLTVAAVSLLQQAIPLIRVTGDGYHQRETAAAWEDRLEMLGEHPAYAVRTPHLDDRAKRLIWQRAVYRTIEKVCYGIWHMLLYQGSSYRDMSPPAGSYRREGMNRWEGRQDSYGKLAAEAFEDFADRYRSTPNGRLSLASVRDIGYLDSHSGHHFSSEEEMQRAERAADAWIRILHRYFLGDQDLVEWAGLTAETKKLSG